MAAAHEDRVVAALGERTYPFGLALGDASGVLVERLSRRCGRLFVLAPGSVGREGAPANVVAVADESDLPDWSFDLVVCLDSLAGASADRLGRLEARLPRAGTLIAVESSGDPGALSELRDRPSLVRIRSDADAALVIERFELRADA